MSSNHEKICTIPAADMEGRRPDSQCTRDVYGMATDLPQLSQERRRGVLADHDLELHLRRESRA